MRKWLFAFCSCLFVSLAAHGAEKSVSGAMLLAEGDGSPGYVAKIEAHSKQEIEAIIERAEAVMDKVLTGERVEPIQFVLHGEEARLFFRKNYLENKVLVDRAARLDAFDVIDIRVCETWLRYNDESVSQLYPFVETVPFGPAEEKRLLSEGYLYF